MTAHFKSRRQELETLATKEGIDWQTRLRGLPAGDDALVIIALASWLKLDVRAAMDGQKSLGELVSSKPVHAPRPLAYVESRIARK